MTPDAYPYESHGSIEMPSPGRWRLNWATTQVASWHYGPKSSDATFAHFFDAPSGCYIEIEGERLDLQPTASRDAKHNAIAEFLRQNTPTS